MLDEKERIQLFKEGWDDGYNAGHRDGGLVYINVLNKLEEIKGMLENIEKEIVDQI